MCYNIRKQKAKELHGLEVVWLFACSAFSQQDIYDLSLSVTCLSWRILQFTMFTFAHFIDSHQKPTSSTVLFWQLSCGRWAQVCHCTRLQINIFSVFINLTHYLHIYTGMWLKTWGKWILTSVMYHKILWSTVKAWLYCGRE